MTPRPMLARAALAVLLAAAMPAAARSQAAAATTPPAAAVFAEQPFLSDPLLSPDGKHIAARVVIGDKTRVMVSTGDKPQYFDIGDLAIRDMHWAGNDRLLLRVTVIGNFYGLPLPITRLFAIEVATGAGTLLDKKSDGFWAGEVLHVDPAGQWVLVASQNDLFSPPSVKRIDLVTGVVTVVEKSRGDVWNWFADSEGTVRAGIAYSGKRWTMWYRERPDAPLVKVRSPRQDDKDDSAVDGLSFAANENSGVIVTNARTGRFGAYRFDFRTGEIGDAIYENDQVDVTDVLIDPARRTVSGVSYEDDRRRVHWIDPAMVEIAARIDRVLPNAQNVVINRSTDGNRLLVWSSSASDPGAYYIYDRAARKFFLFARPFEGLENVALAPVAAVHYAARDGLSIPAYLTLPPGRPAKDLPLILMPHGGPFARDSWDYDPYVQFLASRGYAVLQPQFRGSTGYGKDYVERGYGQWGRAMQDDLDDGVAWLVKSGQVDAKRVCIMGASYGGYAALWGAIRNPELYRCAVSFAGVTDLEAMLRYDRSSFAAPRYARQWQSRMQGDSKFDLDSVSPLPQVARLNIPLFIAHGEKDHTVPAVQSHKLVDALTARKAKPVSVFYKDEAHGLTKKEDLADYLTRLEAFLKEYNPS